jgi:hypothetical protein
MNAIDALIFAQKSTPAACAARAARVAATEARFAKADRTRRASKDFTAAEERRVAKLIADSRAV